MLNKIGSSVLYSILTDGLSFGIILIDRDYRITFWNQWMEKHTGIKERDILGQNLFERYPDIRDRNKDRYIIGCVETGTPVFLSPLFHDYLIPIVRGGNRKKMLQNVKIYSTSDAGEGEGAIIIIEDFTEQIYHDEEIFRLNRLLRAIRNVNQLVVGVESEDELLTPTCKILVEGIGYPFVWVEFIEEGAFDVKPVAYAGIEDEIFAELKNVEVKWDDSEYGQGVTGRAIKTGQTQVVDWIQKDPLCKPWWEFANKFGVQSVCSLPLKVDNNIIGTLTVYSEEPNIFRGEELELLGDVAGDISFAIQSLREKQKRQQAEKVLKESEVMLKTILDASPVGICLTRNRVIIWLNAAITKMTGHEEGSLNGKSVRILYPSDEEYERVGQALYAGMQDEYIIQVEAQVLTKDGRILDCNLYGCLLEPSDISKGILVAVQDISEHKQAERQLKKYSERLEEMVGERTKDLQDAQEQLVKGEKLAILGELAGGMAHELRNPLGAIGNATYFLNMVLEEPEPEVKEALEIMAKEIETSARIIKSLLNFANPKMFIPQQVNINEVVTETLSRIPVPENVEVVNQLDETLPTIKADSDKLGIIFSSIIQNAIHAMMLPGPAGTSRGGRLIIKSELRRGENPCRHDWVAISFTDEGVGIPAENIPKLFEPLFTTKAKGIGFGLAFAKNLIEEHRGVIEVQSEVGKGSTFTVTLNIED